MSTIYSKANIAAWHAAHVKRGMDPERAIHQTADEMGLHSDTVRDAIESTKNQEPSHA